MFRGPHVHVCKAHVHICEFACLGKPHAAFVFGTCDITGNTCHSVIINECLRCTYPNVCLQNMFVHKWSYVFACANILTHIHLDSLSKCFI